MEIRTFRITYNGVAEEEPVIEPEVESASVLSTEPSSSRPSLQSSQEGGISFTAIYLLLGFFISCSFGFFCSQFLQK